MNNLKKALQNLDFTEEQLSHIRKAVMKESDEAHLRIEEEKTHPLIGKWVKCTESSYSFTKGKWYNCLKSPNEQEAFIDNSGNPNGMYGLNSIYFDLTDPRDYEPKTVPADILEGLNLLPEDHPEFGNLRKKAIECAERRGLSPASYGSENKIVRAVGKMHWFNEDTDWEQVFNLAESGAFDPKPVEKRIEFDYERWKKGEYIRVETRDGREILSLMNFDIVDWPLVGVIKDDKAVTSWKQNGSFFTSLPNPKDLLLVVNE